MIRPHAACLLANSSHIMAGSNITDLVQALSTLAGALTAQRSTTSLTPQFPVINQQSSVNMTPRSSSGHSDNQ